MIDTFVFLFILSSALFAVYYENVASLVISTFKLFVLWLGNLESFGSDPECRGGGLNNGICALLVGIGTILTISLLLTSYRMAKSMGWRAFKVVGADMRNIRILTYYQTYVAGVWLCVLDCVNVILMASFILGIGVSKERRRRHMIGVIIGNIAIIAAILSALKASHPRMLFGLALAATMVSLILVIVVSTAFHEGDNTPAESVMVLYLWEMLMGHAVMMYCGGYLYFTTDYQALKKVFLCLKTNGRNLLRSSSSGTYMETSDMRFPVPNVASEVKSPEGNSVRAHLGSMETYSTVYNTLSPPENKSLNTNSISNPLRKQYPGNREHTIGSQVVTGSTTVSGPGTPATPGSDLQASQD
ncbi:hypothetical protein AAMO2058_001276000 [Amorphochlora amoebiformis]